MAAVQMVLSWGRRGELKGTAEGLSPTAQASWDLPEDLGRTWTVAVADFLAGRSQVDRTALELAAVMEVVDHDLWRRACRLANVDPSPHLVDALIRSGLAQEGPHGWRLSNAMVLEALQPSDEAHHGVHEVVARALAERGHAGDAAFEGLHWMAAAAPDRAASPLLRGLLWARNRSDRLYVVRLLADLAAARDHLSVAQHCEVDLVRLKLLRAEGRSGEALSDEIMARAHEHGLADVEAEVQMETATAMLARGELTAAATLLQQLISTRPDGADPFSKMMLAQVLMAKGDLGGPSHRSSRWRSGRSHPPIGEAQSYCSHRSPRRSDSPTRPAWRWQRPSARIEAAADHTDWRTR
jgi:hypothetical protein